MSGGGKLLYAGDGINDTPVLAAADIGIAMGGLGADAAIETADVIIMGDEPSKIDRFFCVLFGRIPQENYPLLMEKSFQHIGKSLDMAHL